ncbi:MAG: hypothetical protein ACLQLH_00150 [Terracidiphilus sp.]
MQVKLFVFNEIEGMIGEGFPNSHGKNSWGLVVSKGCRRRSIFNTPFETSTERLLQSLDSGRIPEPDCATVLEADKRVKSLPPSPPSIFRINNLQNTNRQYR